MYLVQKGSAKVEPFLIFYIPNYKNYYLYIVG